jgi:hypothetical protein
LIAASAQWDVGSARVPDIALVGTIVNFRGDHISHIRSFLDRGDAL